MILSSDEPNIIFVCTEHLVSFCCRARFAGIDDTHGPALDLLNLPGVGEEIQVGVVLHLGCEVLVEVGGVGEDVDGPNGRLHGPAGGIALVTSKSL